MVTLTNLWPVNQVVQKSKHSLKKKERKEKNTKNKTNPTKKPNKEKQKVNTSQEKQLSIGWCLRYRWKRRFSRKKKEKQLLKLRRGEQFDL
jgi:cell division septation protein DedD